jgi:hypothetical protein
MAFCKASHQGRQAGARLLQDGPGRAALLVDQGGQQVHRLDVGVVVAQGQALGVLDGGLERGGEFVETHVLLPIRMIASQMGKASRGFQWLGSRFCMDVALIRRSGGCLPPWS